MALIVDNKNIVQQRTISVERTVGDKWLVSSGINPGDRVIVEGLQKVKPGASARVVPFKTDKN
jgi:membrane fusion protein (multidrug efflux system)